MRNKLFGILVILQIVILAGCGEKQISKCKNLTMVEIEEIKEKVKSMPLEPVAANEVAVLETNFGTIVVQFFPDKAPQHCAYFKRLVKAGFYDCTRFHRIAKNFVIQGGDILTRDNDPTNDGTGSPGYGIPAEFNDTSHEKGVLSMARSSDPNSAGSQFFICLNRETTHHLDGQYTAFGIVIEGLDVVDKISSVETDINEAMNNEPSKPKQSVYIKRAFMEQR